jgi:hypothetical protein
MKRDVALQTVSIEVSGVVSYPPSVVWEAASYFGDTIDYKFSTEQPDNWELRQVCVALKTSLAPTSKLNALGHILEFASLQLLSVVPFNT